MNKSTSGDSKNTGLMHNMGPFLVGGTVLLATLAASASYIAAPAAMRIAIPIPLDRTPIACMPSALSTPRCATTCGCSRPWAV